MQQGSWAVLGMEIECVLLRLLPSVPLISFDQYASESRRNRPRTANLNQCAQFMTNYNKRITVLIRLEVVCRHL